MPKLIVDHNHTGKLIVHQPKLLGKVSKNKIGDICLQWAWTYTRSTKHNKHQVILMHAHYMKEAMQLK
jgi:hypothetical protein